MIRFAKLTKKFPLKRSLLWEPNKYIHALNGIDIEFPSQKTIGLVGESGSGKSTLVKILMGLHKPTQGYFAYDNFLSPYMQQADWLRFYRQVAMVFQDPYSSLNPRLKIKDIVSEPLQIQKKHLGLSAKEILWQTQEALSLVGLSAYDLEKKPRQFSGGQRQRIGIARALTLRPKLLILDEPVSSLDMSVQAQIINLLQDLKDRFELSYIFIAHDLGVVEYLCDYVAVMYLGSIVEYGTAHDVFSSPRHPYTASLLEARPNIEAFGKPFVSLQGEIPSAIDLPQGCTFAARCSQATPLCLESHPPKSDLKNNEKGFFCCHHPLI